ncbi:hypothetical protein L798_02423 [Zootermopsis nevadensis]|uniref:Uncharacterized protein n=1 Tax=Zootermopsis nevadensis TaxID=136037 RepID=A0A067QJZ7_ZOONE|nr:hypothetical protein L798_02423 [Zootermopsis nevadensis]
MGRSAFTNKRQKASISFVLQETKFPFWSDNVKKIKFYLLDQPSFSEPHTDSNLTLSSLDVSISDCLQPGIPIQTKSGQADASLSPGIASLSHDLLRSSLVLNLVFPPTYHTVLASRQVSNFTIARLHTFS